MTDAELAVLSIIAEGPIYGYDVQTVIAQRGLRAWTNIGVSSLYYVLEKLERQGLIESQGASEVKDATRRQYRITPAGFGVLQTAVADLLSTPRETASGFELGLANLYVLRPSQIRTTLVTYEQELVSRLAQTRERWQQLNVAQAPFNVDAMFGHHVALLKAELEWVRQFIEEWESQAPSDEPGSYPPEPQEIPRMKQVILPHDPDSPHRAPTRPLHGPPDLPAEAPDLDPGTLASKQTRLSAQTPLQLTSDQLDNASDDDSSDE